MVVESLKIQLRMTKHPSRKVMNFRHLLGCDTIVANLAFYETMSFATQRMSSKTSLIWQSRSLVRDQAAKATNGQKNGSAEESKDNVSLLKGMLYVDK